MRILPELSAGFRVEPEASPMAPYADYVEFTYDYAPSTDAVSQVNGRRVSVEALIERILALRGREVAGTTAHSRGIDQGRASPPGHHQKLL